MPKRGARVYHPGMTGVAAPPAIFDRRLVRQRRERSGAHFTDHDFLHRRAMAEIVDRLEIVTRDFPLAAFIGVGPLFSMLTPDCGVGRVIAVDLARARLGGERGLIGDEERLPFSEQSLDLIVSLLTLHTANDLIGALAQARRSLRPDGLFLAALFGEETLKKLRAAFYAAETELTGGVSPRVAPFASVRDLGSALQRAGFALPVADVDRLTVRYNDPSRLLQDLRGMGETNVLHERGRSLSRAAICAALGHFTRQGGIEHFDIVYLTGWAPHESQQKPLKPGSGETSLKTAIIQSQKTKT